jgi:hypothetical protein
MKLQEKVWNPPTLSIVVQGIELNLWPTLHNEDAILIIDTALNVLRHASKVSFYCPAHLSNTLE